MKHIRTIVFLLCAVLLLSLAGCTTVPAETTAPPTTVSPADTVYAPARQLLQELTDVTLDMTVTTYMTVNGDEYSERSTRTLSYQGIGTETFAAELDSTLLYSVHAETQEDATVAYQEIYADGTLYASSHEAYRYSAPMDAQEAAARFTPVVLLDASLYGAVTAEEVESGTKLQFADPTDAESWALPAEAEFVDANGSAVVSAEGTITQMNYAVEYLYGSAKLKLEVESKPRAEATAIAAPEHPDSYPVIGDINALYLSLRASNMLAQADSITATSTESVFSQAAGYMRNQSCKVDLYGRRNGTQSKMETNITGMDFNTGSTDVYKQEELYVGGRYTVTANDGLPSTQSGIAWEDIREYCFQNILSYMLLPDFWQDVKTTDLGSVCLLEFTLNENYGNTMQNAISEVLWSDPSFLLNMASKYETNEVNGYLSVDKYTGITVAGGFYYKGTHTIDGVEYPLTMQFDQTVEAPAIGAFEEITGNPPMEEEPENKAKPLFYHVTGDGGQEMWLLGTIHVGDERTAYLPQELRTAFEASDALALELNSEALETQMEEDPTMQALVAKAYYYSDGTTLEKVMGAEGYARAIQLAKATGNYNNNIAVAKPYMLYNGIEQFYLRQAQTLHGDRGMEMRLMDWAEELNKPIREIESGTAQIEMLGGYSNDLQLLLLKEIMDTTGMEFWEETQNLYELWCLGDEAALRELVSTTVNTEELTPEELAEYEANKHLLEEYNKAMSYDRNEGMLEVAKEYLESGDTVFYAVGLAHLLDDVNGLVDALREAGYTVEAVAYQ